MKRAFSILIVIVGFVGALLTGMATFGGEKKILIGELMLDMSFVTILHFILSVALLVAGLALIVIFQFREARHEA